MPARLSTHALCSADSCQQPAKQSLLLQQHNMGQPVHSTQPDCCCQAAVVPRVPHCHHSCLLLPLQRNIPGNSTQPETDTLHLQLPLLLWDILGLLLLLLLHHGALLLLLCVAHKLKQVLRQRSVWQWEHSRGVAPMADGIYINGSSGIDMRMV